MWPRYKFGIGAHNSLLLALGANLHHSISFKQLASLWNSYSLSISSSLSPNLYLYSLNPPKFCPTLRHIEHKLGITHVNNKNIRKTTTAAPKRSRIHLPQLPRWPLASPEILPRSFRTLPAKPSRCQIEALAHSGYYQD